MTMAPSSLIIIASFSSLGPPLVVVFALLGELPSSTSENGLLVPLDLDEVPLVPGAATISWVPFDGCAGFFLLGIGDGGASISGSVGAGILTPFTDFSPNASLLERH